MNELINGKIKDIQVGMMVGTPEHRDFVTGKMANAAGRTIMFSPSKYKDWYIDEEAEYLWHKSWIDFDKGGEA